MSTSAKDTARTPKTTRGRRTRDKILDAAALEFGELGFHKTSIGGVTDRAGVALGTFYVYFESKEEIFRSLVTRMGELTRAWIAGRIADAPDRLAAERLGVEAFLEFVRAHSNLYRIVMEAQFVAEDAYRDYYSVFAAAYRRNLDAAAAVGEIRAGDNEERAWALIGMSVFLGLRYAIWDEGRPAREIAEAVGDLIENGLAPCTREPNSAKR